MEVILISLKSVCFHRKRMLCPGIDLKKTKNRILPPKKAGLERAMVTTFTTGSTTSSLVGNVNLLRLRP